MKRSDGEKTYLVGRSCRDKRVYLSNLWDDGNREEDGFWQVCWAKDWTQMRMFICALGSLSDRLYYLMIGAGFPILFTVPGLGKGTWRGQSLLSFTDKAWSKPQGFHIQDWSRSFAKHKWSHRIMDERISWVVNKVLLNVDLQKTVPSGSTRCRVSARGSGVRGEATVHGKPCFHWPIIKDSINCSLMARGLLEPFWISSSGTDESGSAFNGMWTHSRSESKLCLLGLCTWA